MVRIGIVFIIICACFMSFLRFKNKDTGYAVAWLLCAAVNLYYLFFLSTPS